MSLPNYLSSIKASGMYRFIFDKSQAPAEELQQLRLVVGYSEKGPFNTPVYVEDDTDFKNTFGGISKKLERKGIYFHRMALQCLEKSPILCLNLKDLDDEVVDGLSFNAGALGDKISTAVNKIYNTNRFWTLEPEKLNADNGYDNYINISATDDKSASTSVFVRSFVPTGYNVTFADWYSQNTNGEEMPSYLEGHENERVQDYFAEVYVFKGEFTPALAASETLNKYFKVENGVVSLRTDLTNAFGEKIDTLDALASDSNSNFINKYAGILLSEFKNSTNTIISLDAQFNTDNTKHKLMMHFNQDLLWDEEISITDLNTTGYNLIESIEVLNEDKITKVIDVPGIPAIPATPEIPEISHQAVYVATFAKTQTGTTDPTPATPDTYPVDVYNITDDIAVTSNDAIASAANAALKKNDYTEENIKAMTKNNGTAVLTYTNSADKEFRVTWTYVKGSSEIPGDPIYEISIDEITREGVSLQGQALLDASALVTIPSVADYDNGTTSQTWEGTDEEDKIVTQEYVAPTEGQDAVEEVSHNEVNAAGTYITVKNNAQLFSNKSINVVYAKADYEDGAWKFNESNEPLDDEPSILIYNGIETLSANDENLYELDSKLNSVTLAIGDKIFANGKVLILSYIKSVTNDDNTTSKLVGFVDETGEAYTTDIKNYFAVFTHSIGDKIYDTFNTTYLKGYDYNGGYEDFIATKGYPKGSQWSKLQWHKSILSVLTNWKGIRTGLTNRVDSDWRYLVDTFEPYVDEEIHGELSVIAKMKQNALALNNFPSVATLSKCEYTSFTDADGIFQVKYIKDGGNRQKPMSVKMGLPAEINGAVYSAYFTPVVIKENGVNKTIPSAALVSNLFIDKLENRFPYSFVAGPNYARLTASGLVGPEFNFDKDELGILETLGVNAIVYQPTKGTFINSNKTAKQNPVSALSYINVIEMAIFLQDEIEKMLQNYQWEYNTAELRGTVKGRADKICELIENNGGIAKDGYYNQCDENNNTEDVINNEMFIISTSVEPGMGCGKMIQELTIYRQGGMKALLGENK